MVNKDNIVRFPKDKHKHLQERLVNSLEQLGTQTSPQNAIQFNLYVLANAIAWYFEKNSYSAIDIACAMLRRHHKMAISRKEKLET